MTTEKRLSSRYLHNSIIRHTNITIPHSDFITYDNYPKQYSDKIGTIVELEYRDHYMVIEKEKNLHESDFNLEKNKFLICRCDSEEPFVFIGISTDYKVVLVGKSNNLKEIYTYPIQLSGFIGVDLYDNYEDKYRRYGTIIRADNGEPCYTVIVEFLDDNFIRFVLGDEVIANVTEYYLKNPVDDDNHSIQEIIDIRKSILEGVQ